MKWRVSILICCMVDWAVFGESHFDGYTEVCMEYGRHPGVKSLRVILESIFSRVFLGRYHHTVKKCDKAPLCAPPCTSRRPLFAVFAPAARSP